MTISMQCYDCDNVFKTYNRDGWNIYCNECRSKEIEKVAKIFRDVKPCPWCGSKLLVEERIGYVKPHGEQIAIVCVDCNSRGPTCHITKNDEILKKLWNERKQ